MKKNFEIFCVISLFVIGAFLRLYNFPSRVIYGPEQGISLLTSAANLTKFSLLGDYNLQRSTSSGLNLIHGPLFNYFLLPFVVLFNYRVLPISYIFAFLNLGTALIFYFVVKRFFGTVNGLLALFFFMFSDVMIYHSLFIWMYNPLILIGVLSLLFWRSPFWLGLFSGLGFSLQDPYLLTAIILFFVTFFFSQKKFSSISLYITGFFLANITRILFDFKHDFYYLRTLWQYFKDVYIHHTISGSLYYYHYLHLYPLLFLFFAFITLSLYKVYKPLAFVIVAVFLFTNLSSTRVDFQISTGMPPGLTLGSLEKAAAVIAADKPSDFNVVTLWDFDTQAHTLRYLLQYYYHLTPAGVADYDKVNTTYAFAPASRDIKNPKVYELNVLLPYKVIEMPSPAAGYKLYKLTK